MTFDEKFPISAQLDAELKAALASASTTSDQLNAVIESFGGAFLSLEALVRGESHQWIGRTKDGSSVG